MAAVPPIGLTPASSSGGGDIPDLLALGLGLAVVMLGWLSVRSVDRPTRSKADARHVREEVDQHAA